MLSRHLEHVTAASLPDDLLDLPTPAEVLDAVPDPRSRRDAALASARCRRYPCSPCSAEQPP
ncbi:hypothetical protein [Nonomuraea coxensis]|uniref:hypothetical protein n=1 Tax=Nonomuraea coxensis TaxID=404386 RepID=UPI00039A60F1|nr:hypothetical protein [Nonomuraea coxensis]